MQIMRSNWRILVKKEGDVWSNLCVAQMDPKGSIPLFILNNWNDGFVKEVKDYHKDV